MINQVHIEGFVLAGGKSSRMGSDKALLKINDHTFLEQIVGVMKHELHQVSLISNHLPHHQYGLAVYEDIIKEKGPLGGIFTALHHCHTQKIFICPCDLPFMDARLIHHLIKHCDQHEIIIPSHHGKIEPLIGIYDKSCAKRISGLLKYNKLSISKVLSFFDVKIIPVEHEKFYTHYLFQNINTMQEYTNINTVINLHV